MSDSILEDPYKTLGVPDDATKDSIRSAYLKIIHRVHPDRCKDESLRSQNQDEFQRAQQAYELLSDESRRVLYDEMVKREELKKYLAEERGKSRRRFSFRARPREFGDGNFTGLLETRPPSPKLYEQRRPKYSEYERPSQAKDEERARRTRRARMEYERERERERDGDRDREQAKERDRKYHRGARDRDRERRREYDGRYARAESGHSEEDEPRTAGKPDKVRADEEYIVRRIASEKIPAALEYIRRSQVPDDDREPARISSARPRRREVSPPPGRSRRSEEPPSPPRPHRSKATPPPAPPQHSEAPPLLTRSNSAPNHERGRTATRESPTNPSGYRSSSQQGRPTSRQGRPASRSRATSRHGRPSSQHGRIPSPHRGAETGAAPLVRTMSAPSTAQPIVPKPRPSQDIDSSSSPDEYAPRTKYYRYPSEPISYSVGNREPVSQDPLRGVPPSRLFERLRAGIRSRHAADTSGRSSVDV
ncbi:MAG: hypothetical protein M1813_005627 [Trichoglossum hirsutum]|jgi:curved DNA-binding protein CbpA|nr:MAG: hypothetical protein M1813_005627 [Trichoglossum hirsutum]